MKAIAIIPARGGSRRLPRKNVRPLCGVPLVAWSIRAAQDAKLVSEVYVSTDDLEIAMEAERYGAEVVMRPPEISGDEARIEDALLHAVHVVVEARIRAGKTAEEIKAATIRPDVVVTLQPTSPFRAEGLIDQCISRLQERAHINTALTVRRAGVTWWEEYDYGPGGSRLVHQFGDRPIPQSQDWQIHHERWSEDGSVFATRYWPLKESRDRRKGPVSLVVNDMSPDIDTAEDWKLAEAFLRAREEVPA
jgi:CMP-N,N'-diacetyllegionaminic acid synthase